VTEEHSASILTVEDLEDGNSTKMFWDVTPCSDW
jgi:hypothetical protein